jgi:hypothetical protein
MSAKHRLAQGDVDPSRHFSLNAIAFAKTAEWNFKREVEKTNSIKALVENRDGYVGVLVDQALEWPLGSHICPNSCLIWLGAPKYVFCRMVELGENETTTTSSDLAKFIPSMGARMGKQFCVPPFSFLVWAVGIASAPTRRGQGHGAFRREVHEGGRSPAMLMASRRRALPWPCYFVPRCIRPLLACH